MLCTPVQVRAARIFLGWSQTRLAKEADVARSTLALIERGDNLSNNASREKIQRTLERAGLEFLPPDDTKGSGLRYADRETEKAVAVNAGND